MFLRISFSVGEVGVPRIEGGQSGMSPTSTSEGLNGAAMLRPQGMMPRRTWPADMYA